MTKDNIDLQASKDLLEQAKNKICDEFKKFEKLQEIRLAGKNDRILKLENDYNSLKNSQQQILDENKDLKERIRNIGRFVQNQNNES